MCDAVRRILSLAGADPRELDLVAFGGMGAVHAARHAALLGMRRVLIPRAAPAFSALGLLTANHVIDEARTLQGDWRQIDLGTAQRAGGRARRPRPTDALEVAGIPAERRVFEWRINLVYPGQTFDVAIPIEKAAGSPISQDALEAAVERVPPPQRGGPPHRGPLAGAGASAASGCWPPGWSTSPLELVLDEAPLAEPIARRRVFTGDAWHDDVPVYDGDALRPGASVAGPGAACRAGSPPSCWPPATSARMQPNGDVLIEVAPA